MRNPYYLIDDILNHIPKDQPLFIANIQHIQRMSMQSPPENPDIWRELYNAIKTYIPYPSEHWEFLVLSLVSGIDILTLKESDNLPINPYEK